MFTYLSAHYIDQRVATVFQFTGHKLFWKKEESLFINKSSNLYIYKGCIHYEHRDKCMLNTLENSDLDHLFFVREILDNGFICRIEPVLRAVVMSSIGRLLVILALVWGHTYSGLGVAFTRTFVAASNIQALRGKFHYFLSVSWEVEMLSVCPFNKH